MQNTKTVCGVQVPNYGGSLAHQVERAAYWLKQERDWMEEHGSTLSAYIARYGSKDDSEHYGDGGEAIYEADLAALNKKEEEYLALRLLLDQKR